MTVADLGGDKGGCTLDWIGGYRLHRKRCRKRRWVSGILHDLTSGETEVEASVRNVMSRGRDENPADPVESDLAPRVTVADRDRGAGGSFLKCVLSGRNFDLNWHYWRHVWQS